MSKRRKNMTEEEFIHAVNKFPSFHDWANLKLNFSHLIALALGAQIGELYFYTPIPEPWKSVLIYLTLCAGYFLFKIFDKDEKENVEEVYGGERKIE